MTPPIHTLWPAPVVVQGKSAHICHLRLNRAVKPHTIDPLTGPFTPLGCCRTDSGKRWWYLPFLDSWSGGNSGSDRPAYGDGFSSHYTMPRVETSMGCKNNGQCDMFQVGDWWP